MRVAIYIRQSETGGAGADSLSIASQETALRARCEAEGWTPVLLAIDADLKGWQDETERPGLNRVLDAAARGDLDLLLVWDLSRLARSVEYQERWVRILGRMGIEIEAHAEPEVRRSTLLRQIKGAIAEEKTREIQAHVRRAMRQRAERGLSHGRAPFGYRRAPRSPLEPDPDAAPLVAAAFAMRAAGASTEEVRRWLDERAPTPAGAAGWRWETVHQMLRNPVYKGTLVSGPVTLEDAHPAIVGAAVWERAQARATHHRQRAQAAGLSWLAGLVDHGCGRRMHLIAPNSSHPVPYFRCSHASANLLGPRSCHHRPASLSARKLEAAAWELALAALDRIGDPAAVLAAMRRAYREQLPDAGRERRQAEQALARAEARLARAEELYLSGARDRAWFTAEDARAGDDLEAARSRLAALPAAPDRAAVEGRLRELRRLRDAAALMTEPQRGELVGLLGRVAVAGPGDVRLVLDPAVERLLRPA